MITGIICVVCAAVLLMKAVSRRLHWEKADKILGKIHSPVGIILVFLIGIHMASTYRVWDTRSLLVVVSGIIAGILFVMMAVTRLLHKLPGKFTAKLHRAGALLIIVVLLIHIGSYYQDFLAYQKAIKNTHLSGMDASELPDGNYIGEYDAGYISAKVNVEVRAGKIDNITILEHNNERGGSAEQIIHQVTRSQTTKVDVVSGATNSSKVIIKAVEKALEEGQKR